MKTIVAFILGWVLCVGFSEYQYYEHYDLTVDALDKGLTRKKNDQGISEITTYVEDNRTKVLDYINHRPELWKCRFVFEHSGCKFKSLLRRPIPIKDRPKRD